MSNQQLYLVVGVPLVVSILSWISALIVLLLNHGRINDTNQRVRRIEDGMHVGQLSLDAVRQDVAAVRSRYAAHEDATDPKKPLVN